MHTLPEERSLAALQSSIGAALLAADASGQGLPEALFAGVLPGAEGLSVHRNTVLGALSHALRLSYPTVDRLVGEAFFDRMAVEYSRAHPPVAPQLTVWGAAFSEFIDGFAGTDNLPFLAEVARFDAQFDALGRCAADEGFHGAKVELELDGGSGVSLSFNAHLRVHRSRFDVRALRDAINAEDAAAIDALNYRGAGKDSEAGSLGVEHSYALWRTAAGVMVRELSPVSAKFVRAVLRNETFEHIEANNVAVLQREVLAAGFVRISDTATAAGMA